MVDTTQMSPITPTDVASNVAYCDDVVPSEMAANFRNYMTHLSQLSPDHDTRGTALFDTHGTVTRLRPGNDGWTDSMVDMFSSGSDSEECSLNCDLPVIRNSGHLGGDRSDRMVENTRACDIHERSHLRRNPHFPYESLGTPRVAWGETPREAWSETPRDTWSETPRDSWSDHADDSMYDSLNPYALFNLPKSNQRGKRKQKSNSCLCRSRTSGISRGLVSPDNALVSQHHNSSHIPLPQNETFSSHNRSSPLAHETSKHDQHLDITTFSHNTDHSRSPDLGLNLSREHATQDDCIESRGYIGQSQSPKSSTSTGSVAHTQYGNRILGHSKSLPIFSSQESMDTNSETGESSDTDVDVMSVNHAPAGLAQTPGSHSLILPQYLHEERPCAHSSQSQRAHMHDNLGIVRPKAIKLESGQKSHMCDTSCCEHHPEQRRLDSGLKGNGVMTRRSVHPPDNFEQTLTPPADFFLPSSETRVLEMTPNQQIINNNSSIDNRQPSVICDIRTRNSAQLIPERRKSLKDMHNSVIRERLWPDRPPNSSNLLDSERRIDLTGVDAEDAISSESNVHRADSPVLPEVLFPSASDDSDIEVVKIETNRYYFI